MAELTASTCLSLLQSLDVGSPIAEDDDILFASRVETSVMWDLLGDRIDIVQGTKGSGKSALYQLVSIFADTMLTDRRIAVIKAVDTKGDPIFQRFQREFESFSETDFENFWRVYFISLVTSQFIANKRYAHLLRTASSELKAFKHLAKEQHFPIKDESFSLYTLVGWVITRIPRIKRVEAGVNEAALPTLGVELEHRTDPGPSTPVFVAELQERLITLLRKADVKLWIMLDRLDEAFPRRSAVERTALRALLRTTLAFKDPMLRLKIFLRDDIFSSVTDDPGGFVALTHVKARCSPVLRWSKEQILQLLTNRIFSSDTLASHFQINRERLRRDEGYRTASFYRIFPQRLRPGSRQSSTLDWIYKHCEDGNGVVTPRDIIDLIKAAKHMQWDMLRNHRTGTMDCVLSANAIVQGHVTMSKNKRDTYLKAEFQHFWPYIEKFENRKAEHDEASLRAILGRGYEKYLPDLRSIGFLKLNPGGTYAIPFLYRPGLSIRQGKSTVGGQRVPA